MGGRNNNNNKSNSKKGRQAANKKKSNSQLSTNGSTKANALQQQALSVENETRFVSSAGPGCHMARKDNCSSWVIDWEEVDPDDFDSSDHDDEDDGDGGGDSNVNDIPDIAIDPDTSILTVCNVRRTNKNKKARPIVAYVTVYDCPLYDKHQRLLQPGSTTNNQGVTSVCTTLIALVPPNHFAHLCYIDLRRRQSFSSSNSSTNVQSSEFLTLEELRIESDVQEWKEHDNPADTHLQTVAFPLATADSTTTADADAESEVTPPAVSRPFSFLCTQSEGGYLTHFFAGNLHAVDFACPVGTPLVAVGKGRVVSVQDSNTLTGIAVTNLFEWNSILLQLDHADESHYLLTMPDSKDENKRLCVSLENDDKDNVIGMIPTGDMTVQGGPLFVEYVHISKACVQPGDMVEAGQVIGYSGSVGFSPEPHLHFCAYRSDSPTAPTVRVFFHSSPTSSSTTNNNDTEGTAPCQQLQHEDSTPKEATQSELAVEPSRIDDNEKRSIFLPRAGWWYNASGRVRVTP